MQTEVVETCHAVRIACPYCGKGTMHVQGTTVSVLSTGPTALEPLTDDADEQPRYELRYRNLRAFHRREHQRLHQRRVAH